MSLNYTYLALGDSYTAGEGVPLYESYPCQAVQLLRNVGKKFGAPEIIAKTGWTTSELASYIDHTLLNTPYDVVSLLIGVNNQYRGMASSHYALEFEELLTRSLSFAGDKPSKVFVLSIPDWGLTPFAGSLDKAHINREIEIYNGINRSIATKYNANYVDITTGSPETAENPSFLAADGLHPSGKAYKRWAMLLAECINKHIEKS